MDDKKLTARQRDLAFLEDSLEELRVMSHSEKREIAIRAGILSDDGHLTKPYGGDAEPSDKYEKIDMTGA